MLYLIKTNEETYATSKKHRHLFTLIYGIPYLSEFKIDLACMGRGEYVYKVCCEWRWAIKWTDLYYRVIEEYYLLSIWMFESFKWIYSKWLKNQKSRKSKDYPDHDFYMNN